MIYLMRELNDKSDNTSSADTNGEIYEKDDESSKESVQNQNLKLEKQFVRY